MTYQENLRDWDEVTSEVIRLASLAAADAAAEGRPARAVVVKVRYAPFDTVTHSRRLEAPTTDPAAISRAALDALARFTSRRPVRLLGVRTELSS